MAGMENNQAVDLLRDIRELQKTLLGKYEIHLEKYEEALKNQRESMALQKRASQLQRRALLVLLIVIIVGMSLVYLPSIWH